MAIYHMRVTTGSRKGGQSAKAKIAYISREQKYARDKAELLHTESGNMPEWARSPLEYWDGADLYERANGRLFKEVEFALPRELSLDDQRKLVVEFARHLTEDEQLPYSLAIHSGKGENPHCHLVISERINDGVSRPKEQWFKRWNGKDPAKGGAQKSMALRPKEWLENTREAWAQHANRALKQAGISEQIDHRTLEAQGIDRAPGVHLGPNVVEMEARGVRTRRGDQAVKVEEANQELAELRAIRRDIDGRNRPSKASTRNRRPSRADRAPGSSDGIAERGDERDADRVSERVDEAVRDVLGQAEASPFELERWGQEDAKGRRRPVSGKREGKERGEVVAVEPLRVGLAGLRDAYAAARERILDLAAPRGRKKREGHVATRPSRKVDRSVQAMTRQLGGMGCELYDIGIRDAATGKMMHREWTQAEVIDNASWLKRMNATGNDVYVRPAEHERHGLVLADDLSADAIKRMKADGMEPAVVVETSPDNFQAWVKVGEQTTAETRKAIARGLVSTYGADPGSADGRHYGRLAGLTNQKPEHALGGRQPWVLCRESSGTGATRGRVVLSEAEQAIAREGQTQKRLRDIENVPTTRRGNALTVYKSEMRGLLKRFKNDLSKCDYIAAMKLASAGHARKEIVQAMRKASPELASRKGRYLDDYCERTVAKVMELPQVKQAREQLTHKRTRGRGR